MYKNFPGYIKAFRDKNFSCPMLESTLNFLETSNFLITDNNVTFLVNFYNSGYQAIDCSSGKPRMLRNREISKSDKARNAKLEKDRAIRQIQEAGVEQIELLEWSFFLIPYYSPLYETTVAAFWTDQAKNYLKTKGKYTEDKIIDARIETTKISEFFNLEKQKLRDFLDSFSKGEIVPQEPFILCPCTNCEVKKAKTLIAKNLSYFIQPRARTPFYFIVNEILQAKLNFKNMHKYFIVCQDCERRFISLKTNTIRCDQCGKIAKKLT